MNFERSERQEVLNDLLDVISCLKIHGHELMKNAQLKERWKEKRVRVQDRIEKMSKRDQQWIEEQYQKWLKNNV